MKVRILYYIDKNGSGVGGPFPEFFVFGEDTPDETIWKQFLHTNDELDHPLGEYMDEVDDEDELMEILLGGYDIDGPDMYWNLVTREVATQDETV